MNPDEQRAAIDRRQAELDALFIGAVYTGLDGEAYVVVSAASRGDSESMVILYAQRYDWWLHEIQGRPAARAAEDARDAQIMAAVKARLS